MSGYLPVILTCLVYLFIFIFLVLSTLSVWFIDHTLTHVTHSNRHVRWVCLAQSTNFCDHFYFLHHPLNQQENWILQSYFIIAPLHPDTCLSVSVSWCILFVCEHQSLGMFFVRGTRAPHGAHVNQSGASWPGIIINWRWRACIWTILHSVSSDEPLVSSEFNVTHEHLILFGFYCSLIAEWSAGRLSSSLVFLSFISVTISSRFVSATLQLSAYIYNFVCILSWRVIALSAMISDFFESCLSGKEEEDEGEWNSVTREQLEESALCNSWYTNKYSESLVRVWWLEWWVTWYTLTTFLRYEWVFYLLRPFLVTLHRVSQCIWEFILSFGWNDWISWFESCKCLRRERKICLSLSLSPWLKALKRSYELVNCWLHGTYQWWR